MYISRDKCFVLNMTVYATTYKYIFLTCLTFYLNVIFVESQTAICNQTKIINESRDVPIWTLCKEKEYMQLCNTTNTTLTVPMNTTRQIIIKTCCKGFIPLPCPQNQCNGNNCTTKHNCFELNNTMIYCRTMCAKECVNAVCTGVDKCTCKEEFIKSKDKFKCEHECKSKCTNGVCTKNKCECFETFVKSMDKYKCVCPERYKMDNNSKPQCVPVCKQPCTNGFCHSPGKCKCNFGYEATENDTMCSPICTPECLNSTCTQIDTCTCKQNYSKDISKPHRCVTNCATACNQHFCNDPMACNCVEKYYAQNTNDSRCLQHCEERCLNGHCTYPNSCFCPKTNFENGKNYEEVCETSCETYCMTKLEDSANNHWLLKLFVAASNKSLLIATIPVIIVVFAVSVLVVLYNHNLYSCQKISSLLMRKKRSNCHQMNTFPTNRY